MHIHKWVHQPYLCTAITHVQYAQVFSVCCCEHGLCNVCAAVDQTRSVRQPYIQFQLFKKLYLLPLTYSEVVPSAHLHSVTLRLRNSRKSVSYSLLFCELRTLFDRLTYRNILGIIIILNCARPIVA